MVMTFVFVVKAKITKRADTSCVNCTPKVRQKTFGVQFVYEKDICRKT